VFTPKEPHQSRALKGLLFASMRAVRMTMHVRTCLLATALALAMSLVGCDLSHSDFDIAVGNRTANTVSIFANGGKVGDVASNQTAAFTVEETRSDALRSRRDPKLSGKRRPSDFLGSRT
jgi:hypothetical protein